MNVQEFLRAVRIRHLFFATALLLACIAPAAADGLRILKWNVDAQGRIQTYTADGVKKGEPVVAPEIPEDGQGLSATLVPRLGDVYRVQVAGSELFVRDMAIKSSKRAPDQSKVCVGQSDQSVGNGRQVNGVAGKCTPADSR